MNPAIVLFAIEAGVKLGRKINEVLLDETQERSLFLPAGDLVGSITRADAVEFFDDNPALVADGGPYHGLDSDGLVKAYGTIRGINAKIGDISTVTDEAVDIVSNLHKYAQYRKGFGAKPAAQRFLGTIVEIGIDYALAHPEALARDSSTGQYIQAFLNGLDEADFAEGPVDKIACDVFVAGLKVFNDNVSVIASDQRIETLLGGMTGALMDDFKRAPSLADKERRRDFFRRVSANMLMGASVAFGEKPEVFIQGDRSKKIVRSVMTEVLKGLKGKEDLLTNDSFEILVKAAFSVASENPELISENRMIQQTISRTVGALTKSGENIFSGNTAAVILENALYVLGENMETLVDTSDPRRVILAEALSAMSAGLSTALSGGRLKDLFSKDQIAELAEIVLDEVAENPEILLGDSKGDAGKTALAQIIASAGKSLGDDPGKITNGAGALEIVQTALEVAVLNADKLLDLNRKNPETNFLYGIFNEIAVAVLSYEGAPRRLITRRVYTEIAGRVLSAASANMDPILRGHEELVGKAVHAALDLAGDALKNNINGENIGLVIEGLLMEALLGRLDIDDAAKVVIAGRQMLNIV